MLRSQRTRSPLFSANRSANQVPTRSRGVPSQLRRTDRICFPIVARLARRPRPSSSSSRPVAAVAAAAAMASAPIPPAGSGNKPLIYFVTGNQNKLKEVVAILEEASSRETPLPCEVEALDVDLPELQGVPTEIAAAKAEAAAKVVASKRTRGDGQRAVAVIVEDTSLCFDALKGLPGPYVKDFLKAVGPEGLPKLLTGFGDDGAYAQCVFAFAEVVASAEKGGEAADDQAAPLPSSSSSSPSPSSSAAARVFVGRTHGSIARTPRGPRTFGWDCVFVPGGDENENPSRLTYAEMPSEAKNAISHRRRALDKLRAFLVEEYSK